MNTFKTNTYKVMQLFFQLLDLLKNCDIQGDITLVPYANPVACNHKNGEYTTLESPIYAMCVVCVGVFFFLIHVLYGFT